MPNDPWSREDGIGPGQDVEPERPPAFTPKNIVKALLGWLARRLGK